MKIRGTWRLPFNTGEQQDPLRRTYYTELKSDLEVRTLMGPSNEISKPYHQHQLSDFVELFSAIHR